LETGGGRPRGGAWAQCEAEREFLVAKLASRHMGRRLRLTKIRKLLRRERGVDVPYSTLHRFATKELGFGKTTPMIPVAEGEPHFMLPFIRAVEDAARPYGPALAPRFRLC